MFPTVVLLVSKGRYEPVYFRRVEDDFAVRVGSLQGHPPFRFRRNKLRIRRVDGDPTEHAPDLDSFEPRKVRQQFDPW